MQGSTASLIFVLLLWFWAAQCSRPTNKSTSGADLGSIEDVEYGAAVIAYDLAQLRRIATLGDDPHPAQGVWRGHEEVTAFRRGAPTKVQREIRLVIGPEGRAVWATYMPAPEGGLRRGGRFPARWTPGDGGLQIQIAAPGHPRRSEPRGITVNGDVLTTTVLYHSDWGGPGPKWTAVEVHLRRDR